MALTDVLFNGPIFMDEETHPLGTTRIADLHQNPDGTITVTVEVWNDIEGRYLFFDTITVQDGTG